MQACLAKHPDDRVQTAQDVKLQLEWLRADSAASGGAAAPVARAPRGLPLVLGVALFAVAVVAGFLAGRRAAPVAPTSDPTDIQRRTFRSQSIFAARFLNDAKTLVLSAAPTGNRPRLFVLRADSPEPRPVGPEDVHLLAVSSRGELAVLDHARYTGHHRLFEGTLSRMPLEGAAPRPLMDGVREADWSPGGESLAVIHEVAGKDRLEYPIGKVLFESAGYLSDVRVSPRGDAIAFVEHPQRWDDRGSVNVVGLRGKARVLASGYVSMQGLAWAPSGRSVFFSATENGSEYLVYEVGLDGGKRTPTRRLGFVTLHDVAPDGTWAATHDEIPTRLLYRRAGGDAETDLSWLDSANQPSLSEDGRTLALADQSVLAGAHYSAVVRSTSGGPIVRLGDGIPEEFSPDGKSVVAIVPSTPPRIVSYPIGTGSATQLDSGGFENVSCVRWMPEGKRLLLCGNLPRQASRCFLLDPASRRASAVGPDGLWECFPSPDGSRFAARSSDGWLLCSVSGEPAPKPIPGMRATDEVIRWNREGTALYCFARGEVPSNVDRIDLATGQRRTMTVVGDRDAAGMLAVLSVSMTEDLQSLVYGSSTRSSTLYTVSRARE